MHADNDNRKVRVITLDVTQNRKPADIGQRQIEKNNMVVVVPNLLQCFASGSGLITEYVPVQLLQEKVGSRPCDNMFIDDKNSHVTNPSCVGSSVTQKL